MLETGTPSAASQLPDHPRTDGDSSSIRALSADLHAQVTASLEEDVQTERLKAVQTQGRNSLTTIQEALDRYEVAYVTSLEENVDAMQKKK